MMYLLDSSRQDEAIKTATDLSGHIQGCSIAVSTPRNILYLSSVYHSKMYHSEDTKIFRQVL